MGTSRKITPSVGFEPIFLPFWNWRLYLLVYLGIVVQSKYISVTL